MKRIIALLLVLALPACGRDGERLYDDSVPSVAWITVTGKYNEEGIGSGVAIGDGSLIITAAHVIADDGPIRVRFARRRDDGTVANTAGEYSEWDALLCTVVRRDIGRDLALLRVPGGVPTARPATLARRSPATGEAVFSIGNGPNVLFRHSPGAVRGVYEGTAEIPDRNCPSGFRERRSMVCEITAPVNLGDSGGPVFNRAGEVVGINSWIVVGESMTHLAIDVTEIRGFLRLAGVTP